MEPRHLRDARGVFASGGQCCGVDEGCVRSSAAADHLPGNANDDSGFPSGHATDAAGFFLASAVVLALTVARRPLSQAALVAIGAALTGLVGVSRLVLGVHWLSDVVAGWALGTAIVHAVVATMWYAATHIDRGWAAPSRDSLPGRSSSGKGARGRRA